VFFHLYQHLDSFLCNVSFAYVGELTETKYIVVSGMLKLVLSVNLISVVATMLTHCIDGRLITRLDKMLSSFKLFHFFQHCLLAVSSTFNIFHVLHYLVSTYIFSLFR
jgi:hypothetical protein